MKVLMIAPHADDEILGAGGTIAKFVAEGHEVFVCVVTTGQVAMFPEDTLAQLRNEALDAHQFLGVKKTIFLDFPAVMLSEVPQHRINSRILEVIDEVKPNISFIPHNGDIHLDHSLVSQASMVGLRPIRNHKVLEIYAYETLSETEWNIPQSNNAFLPNTWVDISEYLDKKLVAMNIYLTQLKQFPHPRSLEAIKALARVRGSTVGVNAAESFSLVRRIIL